MADIQTKSFSTLVGEQAATIQGGASSLVDLTIGSILRAIVEAYSAVALWLQALILKVLALTRAATSNGSDLDSWMADYGLTRLPATYASGQVTFSRFTPTSQAIVPVGALVQTGDGTEQYAVVPDATNAAYSAASAGYILGAGVSSITVPVQAVTAGAVANVSVGGISAIGQAIVGVDTVTNPAAIANGEDAESDAALRVRFVEYLASLSKATKSAVAYALTSVQSGLTFDLVENENFDGSANEGYFYVVVDDGSGTPAASLLDKVRIAIDAIRPITSTFGVFAPAVVSVSVILHVALAAGADTVAVPLAVQDAIADYLDTLPLGTSLVWSRLFQVAYEASPQVVGVPLLTINGGTADIPISAQQVIKAGTVTAAPVS